MAEAPERSGQPAADGSTGGEGKPRPLGLILTVVIAAVVISAVAILFALQNYTSPSGTLVATPVGSVTVNGTTLPHVTLAFNTYPDSTGMVNGQPIHPGATPAGRPTGPPTSSRCPPTPW